MQLKTTHICNGIAAFFSNKTTKIGAQIQDIIMSSMLPMHTIQLLEIDTWSIINSCTYLLTLLPAPIDVIDTRMASFTQFK